MPGSKSLRKRLQGLRSSRMAATSTGFPVRGGSSDSRQEKHAPDDRRKRVQGCNGFGSPGSHRWSFEHGSVGNSRRSPSTTADWIGRSHLDPAAGAGDHSRRDSRAGDSRSWSESKGLSRGGDHIEARCQQQIQSSLVHDEASGRRKEWVSYGRYLKRIDDCLGIYGCL